MNEPAVGPVFNMHEAQSSLELNEREDGVQCLQAEVWVLRVQTTGFMQNMLIRRLDHPPKSHPIKLWCLPIYVCLCLYCLYLYFRGKCKQTSLLKENSTLRKQQFCQEEGTPSDRGWSHHLMCNQEVFDTTATMLPWEFGQFRTEVWSFSKGQVGVYILMFLVACVTARVF